MGDMTGYQTVVPLNYTGWGPVALGCGLHVQTVRAAVKLEVFSLFKAQVTHHTQNAACLNGSIAVLLYGLLQNLLPPLRQIPPCMTVKCGSRNNEPSRRNPFTVKDTLRGKPHRDLMFTAILCFTTPL